MYVCVYIYIYIFIHDTYELLLVHQRSKRRALATLVLRDQVGQKAWDAAADASSLETASRLAGCDKAQRGLRLL